MAKYNVKLKDKKEAAEGTMAFYLEKPSGFEFKAGQFIKISLINPPETDTEGASRTFSISSAPYESDLMITTRIRDTAFKRIIKKLELNSELEIDGPFGTFTLHIDETRPAVFLIGGIGITPVRSILLHAAKNKLPHNLHLFYSNRRPEDTAFLNELSNLEKENPNYKFTGTMTEMDKSKKIWNGKTGYINSALLAQNIIDTTKPIYYISGPEQMVAAMRKVLDELNINSDNIKTEEFTGY